MSATGGDEMWTKEFPQAEGFYWARRTQTNAPEPKIIEVWQHEGDWYAYRHGDSRDIEAERFTESLYEYLGPISPSDTAQLVRLRASATEAIKVLSMEFPGSIKRKAAVVALRSALAGEDK